MWSTKENYSTAMCHYKKSFLRDENYFCKICGAHMILLRAQESLTGAFISPGFVLVSSLRSYETAF